MSEDMPIMTEKISEIYARSIQKLYCWYSMSWFDMNLLVLVNFFVTCNYIMFIPSILECIYSKNLDLLKTPGKNGKTNHPKMMVYVVNSGNIDNSP